MKRLLIAFSASAVVLSLAACAEGYYGHGAGPSYYEHATVGYDGFYDDAYGPFYDGYWGEGGFWYSTGEGRPYQLDSAHHFRRDSADGTHPFHGGMHVSGAPHSGGDHR